MFKVPEIKYLCKKYEIIWNRVENETIIQLKPKAANLIYSLKILRKFSHQILKQTKTFKNIWNKVENEATRNYGKNHLVKRSFLSHLNYHQKSS